MGFSVPLQPRCMRIPGWARSERTNARLPFRPLRREMLASWPCSHMPVTRPVCVQACEYAIGAHQQHGYAAATEEGGCASLPDQRLVWVAALKVRTFVLISPLQLGCGLELDAHACAFTVAF